MLFCTSRSIGPETFETFLRDARVMQWSITAEFAVLLHGSLPLAFRRHAWLRVRCHSDAEVVPFGSVSAMPFQADHSWNLSNFNGADFKSGKSWDSFFVVELMPLKTSTGRDFFCLQRTIPVILPRCLSRWPWPPGRRLRRRWVLVDELAICDKRLLRSWTNILGPLAVWDWVSRFGPNIHFHSWTHYAYFMYKYTNICTVLFIQSGYFTTQQ